MPASRMEATDEAIVTFRETPAGVPPAVIAVLRRRAQWVRVHVSPRRTGDDRHGHPAAADHLHVHAGASGRNPGGESRLLSPLSTSREQAGGGVGQGSPVVEPAAEPAVAPAAELPQTASPLPLFAFGGFASLLLGLGAGLLRRRLN